MASHDSDEESSSESHHDAVEIAKYYGRLATEDVEEVPNKRGIKVVKEKNRVYHESYQEQRLSQEDDSVDPRDLRIGAQFKKNFVDSDDESDSGATTNVGLSSMQDISIVLGKKTMNRKNHRQYIESKVRLNVYRYYTLENKRRNGHKNLSFERGTVSGSDRDVTRFTQDIDYYSQLHGDLVLGFELEDIIDALSVSESVAAKAKDRYEVRSSQILRAPLRTHGIDFFHFYPYVLPEKSYLVNGRDHDRTSISSTMSEDLILAGFTNEEIGIANSRNNANNSKRISRAMTKNRCIPVYLLPLFLSGQSAMISSCNSAFNITFKLLEVMRSKRSLFASSNIDRVFDDSLLQLKANMIMMQKSTEDAANLMQDIMRNGSYMRALYDQLIERLQCYDYELYEKIMFDRGIASSMKMSLHAPVIQTQNSLPVVDINYERRVSLFRIFDDFMNEYEKRHEHWNSDNRILFQEERVRQLQRFDLMDTMTRYLLYGLKVTYPVENIIHVFRRYMQENYEQMDEIAAGYFKELDNAYAMRLVKIGAAKEEDKTAEIINEALAIKSEIEEASLKEYEAQLERIQEHAAALTKRVEHLKESKEKGKRQAKRKREESNDEKEEAKLPQQTTTTRVGSEEEDIYASPEISIAPKSSPKAKRNVFIDFDESDADDANREQDNMDVEQKEEEEEKESIDTTVTASPPSKKRRVILGSDSDDD